MQMRHVFMCLMSQRPNIPIDNVNKSALLQGCWSERDHCFVIVQMCRYLQHKLAIICTYDYAQNSSSPVYPTNILKLIPFCLWNEIKPFCNINMTCIVSSGVRLLIFCALSLLVFTICVFGWQIWKWCVKYHSAGYFYCHFALAI